MAKLCSDVVLAGMAWNPRDGGAGVKELGHWGHRLQGAVVLVLERDSYQSRTNSTPECLVSYLSGQYPSAVTLCTMLRCKPGGLFRPEPSLRR